MKGISLHFGLNYVCKKKYKGWDGKSRTSVADALLMAQMASNLGYDVQGCFLSKNATTENFKNALKSAVKELEENDILFISFSGHGGQIRDRNGDEIDGFDEFWYLYDGIIRDDYMVKFIKSIKTKIRLIIVADCCHSGGMIEDLPLKNYNVAGSQFFIGNPLPVEDIEVQIQLLACCRENQVAYEKEFLNSKYSIFTEYLDRYLRTGKFKNYNLLFQQLQKDLKHKQTPIHLKRGLNVEDFASQSPFQIKFTESK